MPEDMVPQIERIQQIIKLFSIPVWILPRYEADDIIGTAVKKAEELGIESFIISPDKDLIQLITDKIKIIKPGKSSNDLEFLTKEKILTDFGFEPIQMIDYLALVGDSSDFIPGVSGVGPKTAIPLIQKFKTIEEIYNNLDNIESKSVRTKLEISKSNAFISKELATINTDVPINFDFKEAELTIPNLDELKNVFEELEFKSFFVKVKKFFDNRFEQKDTRLPNEFQPVDTHDSINKSNLGQQFSKASVDYHLIKTIEDAKVLKEQLEQADLFVFDTETDSLNLFNVNLAGVSFAVKEGEAFFVALNPFIQQGSLFQKSLNDRIPVNDFIKLFKPLFENEKIKKVCQNGKYDVGVMRSYNVEVKNFYFDTMIASYVIDPDQKHGMDELSMKYLNYKPIALSELIGNKKDPSKIFDVEAEQLSNYSAEDADVTLRLFNILKKEIDNELLGKLCYEVEFPLIEVLEDMERTGVKVDRASLKQFSSDLEILMDEYTRNIYLLAGENFNINSPQQMQKILFEKLNLTAGKKTKTGYSTDARSLENLKGEHEIIDVILNYRQAAKLKSTYADALQNLIEPSTGRVHTSFNQAVASTGRLSSNEPNLQNIPIRTEMGKEIRKAFVARDSNHLILSADYSQIELRIMASICSDETLKNAFVNREDIHRKTAALVFGVNPEDVTSDMRRKAKEVNFGILYGIGAFGLKTRLGISQSHASEIIKTYFSSFNKIKMFMDESVKSAREKGYAETLLGRRRYLRNINSSNFTVKNFEERAAINMPIQGTAADMIKIAMNRIWRELKRQNFKSKMVLQVHDELVFDAQKDELDELIQLVKELMETAIPLSVPVVVDTGVGDNWLDAH
jgi:DNA polymerase-1